MHEGVGCSEVTIMNTGGAAPPPPLPPPPRRRLSPLRDLVTAIVAASTIIGVLALLYWPRTIRVAVATATLARFEVDHYEENATSITAVLSYNLTAVLAISNPNRRVSIYYDQLQALGFYHDERFVRAALPMLFQRTKSTNAVPVVLVGSSPTYVFSLESSDNKMGVFPVDLFVDGIARYKFGKLRTTMASTLTVRCHLVLKLMVTSDWVDCTSDF